MTAQELAISDIKEELCKQSKSFIAFREELNPTMKSLVRKQIAAQKKLETPFYHSKTHKVAKCLFAKGKIEFFNYTKKHEKKRYSNI